MKNYIRSAFGLAVMVTLMTFALRYIPMDFVTKVNIKHTDIIADLNRGNTIEELDQLDGEIGADTPQEKTPRKNTPDSDTVVAKKLTDNNLINFTIGQADDSTNISLDTLIIAEEKDLIPIVQIQPIETVDSLPTAPIEQNGITPIVDYSKDGGMLQIFTTRLSNVRGMSRPIRIGFMGDSFIEGDLLTNDFREMMQTKYGGGGVGFVPITSQVAGFRQTVAHKFKDWKQRSILRHKDDIFTISAFKYTPEENSFVEYKGSRNKKHLSNFNQARMLFISHGRSVIRATVNETQEYLFNTEPSKELQEFILEGDITSVRYTVSDVEGFTAYGVFLDDNVGVCVDNFSVRSNSGTLMRRVNLGLSRQFRQLAPYDLIVLQYGLNVASKGVTKYTDYQRQMTMVVNHIKHCFPNAAIMIMSIGDRSTRVNGTFVTMSGIKAMVRTQEQIAQDCGVLFWNTYDAMIEDGGMGKFVKNGWAAKDYTHISSRGGKKIATRLHDAIIAATAK